MADDTQNRSDRAVADGAGMTPAAGEDRWHGAGDRIQTLLDSCSAGGVAARERAEQLVREVVELYGEGLQRILGALDKPALHRLVDDDLVASLLVVHGLHPQDVVARVQAALARVRPHLASRGGDVTVRDIDDAVVRLELTSAGRGCPSSTAALEAVVHEAVRDAAPEVDTIEFVTAPSDSTVIAAESLFARVRGEVVA